MSKSGRKNHRWSENDYATLLARRNQTPEEPKAKPVSVFFIIPGEPQAKPRQTQSDVWKKRDVVVKYRAWADTARLCLRKATGLTKCEAGHLDAKAYFTIPESWDQKRKAEARGQVHRVKPDWDNVGKAIADALCVKDEMIYEGRVKKLWDDGQGPRVEVSIYP